MKFKFNKDLTKNEKYVIKWFEENGFDIIGIKQYNSKTEIKFSKDGEFGAFELQFGVTNIRKYMQMFKQSYDMKIECKRMMQLLE